MHWSQIEPYMIAPGGLMRCCLQSLDDAIGKAKQRPTEGDTLRCKWCSDEFGMVFKGGAWRWANIE